jgi:hypothetical protein
MIVKHLDDSSKKSLLELITYSLSSRLSSSSNGQDKLDYISKTNIKQLNQINLISFIHLMPMVDRNITIQES